MVVLSPGVIIAIVVIAAVIVLLIVILLIWCICCTTNKCARWSRRKAIIRDDAVHEQEVAESRRQFNEIRQQHETVRDQLRVKYNLDGGNSNVVVTT